ncbi:hypothetical protein FB192DRAFT_1163314 [Mucor lusitanicus]|uniref:Secreted protein n=1 Tax=Mucor circinelloides f. lusitanicus TaxID=29924 RepID=A0A8H4EY36_MUCCL|nr:hypothetical protein FB192DRAFT_1163314 [Mucor lusitanicus]
MFSIKLPLLIAFYQSSMLHVMSCIESRQTFQYIYLGQETLQLARDIYNAQKKRGAGSVAGVKLHRRFSRNWVVLRQNLGCVAG